MILFFQIKSLIFYKLLNESQIVANFFKGIRTLIVVRSTTTLPLSYKDFFLVQSKGIEPFPEDFQSSEQSPDIRTLHLVL